MMEPIELSFALACEPGHAFEVWTLRTSLWWPKGHSVSGDPHLEVAFEPHVGGRIVERTPAGEEHIWGAITVWDPPRRLAYRWHLRQDPADATDVEVSFEVAPGGGTDVTIVQSGWERLAERGAVLRDRNRGGWDGLLPHFAAACAPMRLAEPAERSTRER
jgi:uncharacterized protein YndB with AHSA1/START domain